VTPERFKQIRRRAGLSLPELANYLWVTDLRTLRRYESGDREVSGPVARLMEQLAEA
jgi:DNA-binding transcriptional regulator YiaG